MTDGPRWRYEFCDLLTDDRVAMLPMSGVQMSGRISTAGTLAGTLAIPNAAVADQVRRIIAQRTAVYSMRSAGPGAPFLPWWGGIVWQNPIASASNGTAAMSISAATFESFLGRGRLERDLPDLLQVEQLDIARTLWTERQAQPGGDIGVQLGTEVSGVLRDRTQYRIGDDLGDRLDKLAAVIDGFEYTIEIYLDAAGNRVKLLRLGYPELTPAGPSPLFSMGPGGGRLLSWNDNTDGTIGDTVFYARGQAPAGDSSNAAADVEPPISYPQAATALLDAGWPRLVRLDDYSSVSDLDTLNAHAQAKRALYSGAVETFTATVSVAGTSWSPAALGAVHRFKIDDAWHQGAELTQRVVGFTIHPPDRGQGETVDLVFETSADEDRPDQEDES